MVQLTKEQTMQECIDFNLTTIAQLEEYLEDMKKKKDGYFMNFSDFLCRVGALESSMVWMFDLERDENAQPRSNRLCECYDRDDIENE